VVPIPAAVALAEKDNLTGRELTEAIVIGYEFFIWRWMRWRKSSAGTRLLLKKTGRSTSKPIRSPKA
jgi:hypothetical protein